VHRVRRRRLKTHRQGDICRSCDIRNRFAGVPAADEQAIRTAAQQSEGAGVFKAKDALGWPLDDVMTLVHMIRSGTL
jgi:hypothetical protein